MWYVSAAYLKLDKLLYMVCTAPFLFFVFRCPPDTELSLGTVNLLAANVVHANGLLTCVRQFVRSLIRGA